MVNSLILEGIVGEKNADRIIRTSRTELGQRDTQRNKNKEPETSRGTSAAAEDEECIYLLSSRFREYRIPKSQVIEFDESEALLDLQFEKVGRYKIR